MSLLPTAFSSARNTCLQVFRRPTVVMRAFSTHSGGDSLLLHRLAETHTHVDFSSSTPRIRYSPSLTSMQRFALARFLFNRDLKPIAPHIRKKLNGCEQLVTMFNEAVSSKVAVPDVSAKEIERLTKQFYGAGAKNKDRVLHIVTGPPGSGKSSRMVEPLQQEYGALVIDSDHFKPHLPNFHSGYGGVAVHGPSMQVAFKMLEKAFKNGDNIVYPTTGGNLSRMKEFIEQARSHGYKVAVHYVDLPVDETLKRTVARSGMRDSVTGHFQLVSPEYVVDGIGDTPRTVFQQLVKDGLIDEYSHISTAGIQKGQQAPVIAKSAKTIKQQMQESGQGKSGKTTGKPTTD